MKQYVGTKMIHAEPMTRGEYNQYRGWQIPENENPEDEGYHIVYPDGYESWSPQKQFDEAYRRVRYLSWMIHHFWQVIQDSPLLPIIAPDQMPIFLF